jgi:hypothetical protein
MQRMPKDVASVFASYSPRLRRALLSLRTSILETAAATKGVGKIEETLKWNEPAYLTSQSKSGSTIRIDVKRGSDTKYAIYFNCKTNLLDSFRSLFPRTFRYRGDREIEFDVNDKIDVKALKLCIGMASPIIATINHDHATHIRFAAGFAGSQSVRHQGGRAAQDVRGAVHDQAWEPAPCTERQAAVHRRRRQHGCGLNVHPHAPRETVRH